MLRTLALSALLLALPAASAAPGDLDPDDDGVPYALESQICGRGLSADLVIGVVLHPWAGRCVGTTDHQGLTRQDFRDSDGDGFGDVVERALCYYEDRNDPADGTCVGDDYTAPNLTP